MTPETLLAGISTSTVSDALDRCGVAGQCLGLKPLDRGFRVVGRAFTLRYLPTGSAGGTVGDFIDDLGPGDVVVIDNGGRLDATVWGDILTMVGHARGIAGTVIDGVCRDSARSLELGYPIFSRGHYMRTGKDRVMLEAVQGPVSIGGVRVEPGDLVFGDADGVVALPRSREAEILDRAQAIEAAEARIRDAVAGGMALKEARIAHGYHALQTRAAS